MDDFSSTGLFNENTELLPGPAALPDGGGPAGVVDTPLKEKPPAGLLGAGVVLPAGAELDP